MIYINDIAEYFFSLLYYFKKNKKAKKMKIINNGIIYFCSCYILIKNSIEAMSFLNVTAI